MPLNDFDYDLPPELIARYPLNNRSDSRLLCLDGHRLFRDIVTLVQPGDLLVFNDTKVIPARLVGHKATGGRVEILVERILSDRQMVVILRASKAPKVGDELLFGEAVRFKVLERKDLFYVLELKEQSTSLLEIIEAIGEIPLPPYMQRRAQESDKARYQTVYAKHKGSVAAPTAGFHFDEPLLKALRENQVEMGYLTLHIGSGTFLPVRVNQIEEHKMHGEYVTISSTLCEQIQAAKARGNRVIAVGTTSVRALESASQAGEIQPYSGDTTLFIYPGYQFRCVDALITNLHLPKSTLLMLVCAFGGYEKVMQAYRAAVAQAYRFYSYGDAMWVRRE